MKRKNINFKKQKRMKSLSETQYNTTCSTTPSFLFKQEKTTAYPNNYSIDETKSSMFIPMIYQTPNTLQPIDNDLNKNYMTNNEQFNAINSIATNQLKKVKKLKNSSKY